MQKKLIRVFLLVMLCAMVTLTTLPTNAAEISDNADTSVAINTRAAGQGSGLPFTMIPGVNITDLWTTNRSSGGHNFVPGNISSGTTITIAGYFNHSSSNGKCKAGVCIPSGGSYTSVLSTYRYRGYPFNDTNGNAVALGSMSLLNDDTTYYGFVKNDSGTGYVYGANIEIGIR